MRLSISLISTFLLVFSSLSFLPTVLATHRRHTKKSQNAIVTARQYHLPPVTRDLINLCISLRVVFGRLPLHLQSIITGDVDTCLCLKDLDIFLDAKVKHLDVVGILKIPTLRVFLDEFLRTSGKTCTLPPHAHFVCTNSDPCQVECDPGFIRVGDRCVCQGPKKLCKGKCLASPNSCDPSATPRSFRSRRNEINTLEEAQRYCGAMEVCGVPSVRDAFECVDTTSNAESCGGCVYPNPWVVTSSGKDCSTPKALTVTCRDSRCVVDSCQKGFKPNGPRDTCVQTSRKRRASVSEPTMIDLGHDNGLTTDLGSSLNNELNWVGERLAPSVIHPLGSKVVSRSHSSCLPPPPQIPDDPPTTLLSLLDLHGDISAIGRTIMGLGSLLGTKCNCHNPPPTTPPGAPAPLLKSVVDLVLSVGTKLKPLTNDPVNIDAVVDLLNQILKASDKCLKVPYLDEDLRDILAQLEDRIRQLLKGVKLVPEGIANCGCKTELVSSLITGLGLKKRSALRRGVACARADMAASSSLSKIKRSLIGLDLTPLGLGGNGIIDAGSLNENLGEPVSGSGDPSAPVDVDLGCLGFKGVNGKIIADLGSAGSCPPSSAINGDSTAPVDVDLDCLMLKGVNGEIIADLGTGLNKLLNEVLGILSPVVHSADIHPCIKPKPCDGGSGPDSGPDSHPPQSSSAGTPPTKTSSSLPPESSDGDSDSTGSCPPGSTIEGDPTAPVDVDLDCLGLKGVDGEIIADLGTGLNKLLNEVLGILSPAAHSADIRPCIKPKPCHGGSGSASGPTIPPATPSLPHTSSCNSSTSTLPSQTGGGNGSGSGSKSSSASVPTSAPTYPDSPSTSTVPTITSQPTSPSGGNSGSSGSCPSGSSGQGDPNAPVDVDLECLRLKGVNGEIITDLGTGLNKLLNEVLGILSPVVHSADIHPCIKPKPCDGGSGRPDSRPPRSSSAGIPPTKTSSSVPPESSDGDSDSAGSCPPGSTIEGDPVDVDLDCLRLKGVNGDIIADLGTGLNKLLNEVLGILSPVVHSADIHPCIKPKPCDGGIGRPDSRPPRSSSAGIPPTKTSSSVPPESSDGDSDSTGSCPTIKGDPSAPVDVDLDCLRLKGVNGDIIADLGIGLNKLLNEVLGILSPVVHSADIHPCIKPKPCDGGKDGSGSGSPTKPTSPKTGATNGTDASTCQKHSGDSTSGDSSHAVDVDLNCIGINTFVTVGLGPQFLSDDVLNPIVHAAPSRRSEFSPPVEVLKATLNESVGVGLSMTDAAKAMFKSCGCKDMPNSKALLVIAVTAKLKTSLDKMQANPTVESTRVVLNTARGVLAVAKSCETMPGLETQLTVVIRDCERLIPKLETLLDGLGACECGEQLSLAPRLRQVSSQ